MTPALWSLGVLVASVSTLVGLSSSASVAASLAASPSPEPADVVRTPPAELVTPGTIGFLVTFGVAVALVLLVRDMVRRNRGLVVRAERRDAELRAAEAAAGAGGGLSGVADDGPAATRPGQPTTGREHDGQGGQRPAAPNG